MSFYANELLFDRILNNLNALQLLLSIVLISGHIDVRNKIVPGSKMRLLPGIVRNSHPDQEGIKEPLTGKYYKLSVLELQIFDDVVL